MFVLQKVQETGRYRKAWNQVQYTQMHSSQSLWKQCLQSNLLKILLIFEEIRQRESLWSSLPIIAKMATKLKQPKIYVKVY